MRRALVSPHISLINLDRSEATGASPDKWCECCFDRRQCSGALLSDPVCLNPPQCLKSTCCRLFDVQMQQTDAAGNQGWAGARARSTAELHQMSGGRFRTPLHVMFSLLELEALSLVCSTWIFVQ